MSIVELRARAQHVQQDQDILLFDHNYAQSNRFALLLFSHVFCVRGHFQVEEFQVRDEQSGDQKDIGHFFRPLHCRTLDQFAHLSHVPRGVSPLSSPDVQQSKLLLYSKRIPSVFYL